MSVALQLPGAPGFSGGGAGPGAVTTGMRQVVRLLGLIRRRFDLVTRRDALAALAPVFADAIAKLRGELARWKGEETFTTANKRALLVQLQELGRGLAGRVKDVTLDRIRVSAEAGMASAVQEIDAIQTALGPRVLAPVPIREVARLVGATDNLDRSLLERHHLRLKTIVREVYSEGLVRAMEHKVAAGLASGRNMTELAHDLESTVEGSYWRAERIGRTESAWAFCQSHVQAGQALVDGGYDDTLVRWIEFVDDATRQPLDIRVAEDSLHLHGQLRRPGDPFDDPGNKNNPRPTEPPNRPNDRATLVVWRASWGEPPGGIGRLDAESQQAWAQALEAARRAA